MGDVAQQGNFALAMLGKLLGKRKAEPEPEHARDAAVRRRVDAEDGGNPAVLDEAQVPVEPGLQPSQEVPEAEAKKDEAPAAPAQANRSPIPSGPEAPKNAEEWRDWSRQLAKSPVLRVEDPLRDTERQRLCGLVHYLRSQYEHKPCLLPLQKELVGFTREQCAEMSKRVVAIIQEYKRDASRTWYSAWGNSRGSHRGKDKAEAGIKELLEIQSDNAAA